MWSLSFKQSSERFNSDVFGNIFKIKRQLEARSTVCINNLIIVCLLILSILKDICKMSITRSWLNRRCCGIKSQERIGLRGVLNLDFKRQFLHDKSLVGFKRLCKIFMTFKILKDYQELSYGFHKIYIIRFYKILKDYQNFKGFITRRQLCFF